MKPELTLMVDNSVRKWMKNGLLHREDGPAVIRGSGENRIEEFWFEGCLINAAMLELHKTLTPEIEKIVKERKVVRLDCLR
jgi:hypothetical protein